MRNIFKRLAIVNGHRRRVPNQFGHISIILFFVYFLNYEIAYSAFLVRMAHFSGDNKRGIRLIWRAYLKIFSIKMKKWLVDFADVVTHCLSAELMVVNQTRPCCTKQEKIWIRFYEQIKHILWSDKWQPNDENDDANLEILSTLALLHSNRTKYPVFAESRCFVIHESKSWIIFL